VNGFGMSAASANGSQAWMPPRMAVFEPKKEPLMFHDVLLATLQVFIVVLIFTCMACAVSYLISTLPVEDED
jgi:hypothetical protein